MKPFTLLAAGLLLATMTHASERLTIAPARLLPDYTKSMLLSWTKAGADRKPFSNFVIADLNSDKRPDIVWGEVPLTGPGGGNIDLGIFLQGADGQLVKSAIVPIHTTCMLEIFPADFNEDGKPDLLANDAGNDLVLALGNGDGTFQDAQFLALAASFYPAVGDLDGDSHLDIVAGSSLDGTVSVFSGRGDGTFAHRAVLAASITPRGGCNGAAGAIMIRDVNRDGKADIMVASPPNNDTYIGSLHVFLGNGDGTFSDPVTTSNVAGWRGATGDFNGDGFPDYAGDRHNPGQLDIWLGRGDGSFARKGGYSLSGIDPVVVSVVDFNDDGIADVTVSGEPPGGCCQTPLSLFLGKGDGTFRSPQTYTAVRGLLPLNVAPHVVDFDVDNLPDLLTFAANTNEAGITVAVNLGPKPSPAAGFQVTIQTATNAVMLEASRSMYVSDCFI